MCDFCFKDMGVIEQKISDGRNRTLSLCPNHVVTALFSGMLDFEPDPKLTCEITGQKGAVKYEDADATYILAPDIMLRLINLSLHKREYRKLIKNRNGKIPFLLHDDFYGDDGTAYQPRMSNASLKKMYYYVNPYALKNGGSV